MNSFAELLGLLETSGSDARRTTILAAWLAAAAPEEQQVAASLLASPPRLRRVRPALLRGLLAARSDPFLVETSLAYVGDLLETVALLWEPRLRANRAPDLADISAALATLGRTELPRRIETWLDACDQPGRLALMRWLTGTLAPAISAGTLQAALAKAGVTAHLPTAQPEEMRQDDLFALPRATPVPGTLHALLLYVETGRSRTAPVTCTLGIWHDGALLPACRTDAGSFSSTISAYAREHETRRFGPVIQVEATSAQGLVVEVAFDDITPGGRARSGLTLANPRILAICPDLHPGDAADLATIQALLPPNARRA